MSHDFTLKLQPGITLADSHVAVSGGKQLDWADLTPRAYPGEQDGAIGDRLLNQAVRKMLAASGDQKGASNAIVQDNFSGPHIQAVHDELVSDSLVPTALQHALWDNSRGDGVGHYKAELSDTVTDSTSGTWSHEVTAGISFTVGVEVGIEGDKATASTNYSLSVAAGHSVTHEVTRQVGSVSAVDYDVQPGCIDLGVLYIQRGSLQAQVRFAVGYAGSVRYWPYGVHPLSPIRTTLISEVAPYLPQWSSVFRIDSVSATDDTIQTVSLDGPSPDDVEDGIRTVLQAAVKS